jgi:hypothetical protein
MNDEQIKAFRAFILKSLRVYRGKGFSKWKKYLENHARRVPSAYRYTLKDFLKQTVNPKDLESVTSFKHNVYLPFIHLYTKQRTSWADRNKQIGIEFHKRLQMALMYCKTLYDVTCLCFGQLRNDYPVSKILEDMCNEMRIPPSAICRLSHIQKRLCKRTRDERIKLFTDQALEFVRAIYSTLSGTPPPDNTDLLEFSLNTRILCHVEFDTCASSCLSGYRIKRRPDCILLAFNKNVSPDVMCQCILECKTSIYNLKRTPNNIIKVKTLLRYITENELYKNGGAANDVGDCSNYYCNAVNQTVDSAMCVVTHLRRYIDGPNDKEKLFTVKTISFLWYGTKDSMTSDAHSVQPPIYVSVQCSSPADTDEIVFCKQCILHSNYSKSLFTHFCKSTSNNSCVEGLSVK